MAITAVAASKAPGRFPLCSPLGNFLAKFNPKPRSADFDALRLRSGHSGLRAVADFLHAHFRKGRKHGGLILLSQARVSYGAGLWDTLN